MTTEKEKQKQFKELATQAGLKKATTDALVAEDYDSTEVVELMSAADLAELNITKGQQKMLQKWVTSLNAASPSNIS